jgi:hypothetical protein
MKPTWPRKGCSKAPINPQSDEGKRENFKMIVTFGMFLPLAADIIFLVIGKQRLYGALSDL